MTLVIVTTRTGEEYQLNAKDGQSLVQALRDADVGDIQALCGGCCSCSTCHVYIDSAFADALPALGGDEADLLDCSEHRESNSRLSCQIQVRSELEGLRITVAPEG
jgi:ferredoxin, 2Fe-2S